MPSSPAGRAHAWHLYTASVPDPTRACPAVTATNKPSTIAWTLSRQSALLVRQWDDATFVFDSFSGRTHYLNGSAAEILALVAEKPLPLAETDAALLQEFAPANPEAFIAASHRVLELLETLGLVTRSA